MQDGITKNVSCFVIQYLILVSNWMMMTATFKWPLQELNCYTCSPNNPRFECPIKLPIMEEIPFAWCDELDGCSRQIYQIGNRRVGVFGCATDNTTLLDPLTCQNKKDSLVPYTHPRLGRIRVLECMVCGYDMCNDWMGEHNHNMPFEIKSRATVGKYY